MPSGKINTDCCSACMVSAAWEKAARAAVREVRLMKTVLDRAMNWPRKGIHLRLLFAVTEV